jgi:hypothetical protein
MNLRSVTLRGRVVRCLAVAGLAAVVAGAGAYFTPDTAEAVEPAQASKSIIQPGSSLDSGAGQCTSNFIFTAQPKNANQKKKIYIGAAAHCAGKGGANETNGCKSGTNGLGYPIKIEGATRPGHLAYSSWIAMKDDDERNDDRCQYNDFALIEIDPEDYNRVSSTVQKFGGPNGLRTRGLKGGDKVYTYGNSDLRIGLGLLSPKSGVLLNEGGNGWTHTVTTLSPGVPGDSGSGFMDSDGNAFGVLSTLAITPVPGSNGVSDLGRMMDYASQHGDLGEIQLVKGSSRFKSSAGIPLLGGL